MEEEQENYKLWRVRKTIVEMVSARGYLVTPEELNQTLEEFKEQYGGRKPERTQLLMIFSHQEDPTDQMFVFFPDEIKVPVKTLRGYVDRMQRDAINRAILVTQSGGLSPSSKQALVEMAPKYILEHFFENELMVNITQHELVPTHIVMTNDEKKELLEKYRLKESQLPKIQHGDPVSRFYGLAKGQVVRIIRPSETAGRYVSYRLVV